MTVNLEEPNESITEYHRCAKCGYVLAPTDLSPCFLHQKDTK